VWKSMTASAEYRSTIWGMIGHPVAS